MSAQALAGIRSQVPAQHHAAFDAEMAKATPAQQAGGLTFLQALIAFLKQIGLSVNWACVVSVLPQLFAAIGNPALLPAVLVAYLACAHPAPAPAPTP